MKMPLEDSREGIKMNPHKEDLIEWFDGRLAIRLEDARVNEREAFRETVKEIRVYCKKKGIEDSYMLDAFTERRDVQYQLLHEHAFDEIDKMRAKLKRKPIE